MALRKRGKKGFWHAYFRKVIARPDGSLKYVTTTVNLGTANKRIAEALEAELMAKNEAARNHQRAQAHLIKLEIAAGLRPPEDLPVITRDHRKRRLKLADGIATAEKYRAVSADVIKIWRRFVKKCGVTFFDEVTPEVALNYLSQNYGDIDKGKSYNNNRAAVSGIFRACLIDAGMSANPIAVVPVRRFVSRHQRPFTLEEFQKIYKAADEPWKTAVLIAWHTGMREETVFNLRWSRLDGDVIRAKPGKTARFGREIEVPLHPQVMARLAQLPRVDDRIFGCFEFYPRSSKFKLYFGALLDSLGISDSSAGLVNFNCFRDSFITRCDEEALPRHATRGIVGQVDDDTTDLYSHDLNTARRIQDFPWVELE